MPHLSDEIDEDATRRRIEDIAAEGLHAMNEYADRSAEIDREYQEKLARQEEAAKAMDQLVAEAREKQQGEAAPQDPAAQSPWLRRESKPTVLSFGGEDLGEDAPATAPLPAPGALPPQAATLPVPLPPEPPPMPTPPSGERASVLSLGYEEDDPAGGPPPAPPPPPVARRPQERPAPSEDDDDMSGHSWMR